MKQFWKEYIIAGLITTMGYFFIYTKLNPIPNWDVFIMCVPLTWILLLTFAFMFSLILNYGEKD